MQPIDAITLKHLARELDVKLADGKINKIQQPSYHELLLQVWVGGTASRQKWYINIRPDMAFTALLTDSSFLTFPKQAPSFCMLLRKHLSSATISRVDTLEGERVLNVWMDNHNELGQPVKLLFSIELMGKHSNMILVDAESQLIIGCAHGVSESMSRLREVSVGYPYMPPPQPDKPLLISLPPQLWEQAAREAQNADVPLASWLTRHYRGVGAAMLGHVLDNADSPSSAALMLQELEQGIHAQPMVSEDRQAFSLVPMPASEGWTPCDGVNAMIGEVFVHHLKGTQLDQQRKRLAGVLKQQAKKLEDRLAQTEGTGEDAIQQLKTAGDRLMVAFSQGQAVTSSCMTFEGYSSEDPALTLEVDPRLTMRENAEAYYRRYKKAVARAKNAEQVREELSRLESFIYESLSALERSESMDELKLIEADCQAQGWIALDKPSKGSVVDSGRAQPMRLSGSEGVTILVGRSGLQNDQLAGKLAKPGDIWLHAFQMPGSHVLVKCDRQGPISNQTLLEAAKLAVYYSDGRRSVNVPVVYTEARYVRKIPGSYPGHVTYTHESTVNVTADEVFQGWLKQQLDAQNTSV